MQTPYFDIRTHVPAPNNTAPKYQNTYNVINRTVVLMENINFTRLFTRPFSSLALEFLPQLDRLESFDLFDEPGNKQACADALNAIRELLGSEGKTIRDFFESGVTGELRKQFEVLSTNGLGIPFLFKQGPDCVAAIDAVVKHLGHMTEMHLYTESKAFHAKNNPEILAAVEQAVAAGVLGGKKNDLYCLSPGSCKAREDDWCSTAPGQNCSILSSS